MAPEGNPTAQEEVKVYVHTNQPRLGLATKMSLSQKFNIELKKRGGGSMRLLNGQKS